MSTEIQKVGTAQALVPQTVDAAYRIAEIMAKSGMFKDVSDANKAFVKIWAGAELGIPPFQAMSNINLVRGIPTMSAAQMASLIKSSGKYDYKVIVKNASECSIDFYQGTTLLGNQSLTMSEAKRAHMHEDWKDGGWKTKQTWVNFPENMLFWRCISNGAKFFTPDIFGGKVYHEGEIPDEQEANENGYYEAQPVTNKKPGKRQVAESMKYQQEHNGETHPNAQVADVVLDDKKIQELQAKIKPGESPEYFDDLEKEIAFTDSLSVEDRVTLIELCIIERIQTVIEPEQAQYVRSRIAKFAPQIGSDSVKDLMGRLMDQGEANGIWYERDKKLFYRPEQEVEQAPEEPAELTEVPTGQVKSKDTGPIETVVEAIAKQENQTEPEQNKKPKKSAVSPTASTPVEATSDDLPF